MRLKTKPDGAKLFAMITKFLFLKMKIPNDRKAELNLKKKHSLML